MNDEKEYYTVQQLAAEMGKSRTTIYRWFDEGLKFEKKPDGRVVRKVVTMDDVREFLTSNPELQ